MLASSSNELIESMDLAHPGMNAAQQFVVVKAPLERVYEQWSRIKNPFDLRSSKSLPESRGVSAQF